MKHPFTLAAPLVVSLAFSLGATAGDHGEMHGDMDVGVGKPDATAPAAAMSTGEVKKVDKGVGKITIRHGPLTNLGMPGMTMVFHVADPAMLDQVKAGDKVAFIAEKKNGALTVTRIEAPRRSDALK